MTHSSRWAIFAAALAGISAVAQDVAVDRERRLWNAEFRDARPAAAAPPSGAVVKGGPAKAGQDRGLLLGLTTWRMREPRPGDRARMLVHESNTGPVVELTPERMAAGAQLTDRDRVRISVEPGRAGYLYIASREVYADGSRGDTYLLFPSRRIRSGSAKVNPGELVEVPEASNSVPYFTLKRSRPDQKGEELLLLLSQDEIPNLMVQTGQVKLNPAMLKEWVEKFGTDVKMLDAPDQAGVALSPAEQHAGAETAKLRRDDPLPQMLFHMPMPGRTAMLAAYTLSLK